MSRTLPPSSHRVRPRVEVLEHRVNPAGQFDPDFGVGGKAIVDFAPLGGLGELPADLVRMPNGQIVTVGSVSRIPAAGKPAEFDFGVTRLNPDGSKDANFAAGGLGVYGFVNPSGGVANDTARRVAVIADGRITVAGEASSDVGIIRLRPDGTPDNLFVDASGRKTFDYGGSSSGFSSVNALAIQSNGSILVGGEFIPPILFLFSDSVAAVSRLTPFGLFDNSFDGDGHLLFQFANGAGSRTDAVLVRPDGKIWVIGTAQDATFKTDLGIALLNSNGTFDNSFSGDGKHVINLGSDFDDVKNAMLLPDGRIVVVGSRSVGGNEEMFVARLTAGGALDGSFATGGIFTKSALTDNLNATDVTVDSMGRLVVVGVDRDELPNEDVNSRIVVARLTPGGQFDPLFANVGFITFAPAGDPRATQTPAVAVRPDLGIVFNFTVNEDGNGNAADFGVGQLIGLDFPPTISDVADRSISAGQSSGPIPFTIGDTETATDLLVVTATSSNQAVIPDANLLLGGAGANRTITVNTLVGIPGTSTITLTVQDAAGNTATDTFLVTVTDFPPTISDVPDQSISAGFSSGPIGFTIGDTETATDLLVLTATSSNTAVIPNANLLLGGTGANRTITVNTQAGVPGTSLITLTVRDAAGNQTTDTFLVTVTDFGPSITDVPDQTVTAGLSTGPIPFIIGDSETLASELEVTATSSNPAVIPNANLILGGTGANRTITVNTLTGVPGTSIITITVRDRAGNTVTDTFLVTVTDLPPAITDVQDQIIEVNTSTGPLAFTIGDFETAPDLLIVTATSSDPVLVPDTGLVLGGTGANRTITVTPAAGLTGTVTITLTVRDAAGFTATDTFVVQVLQFNSPPTIAPIPDQTIPANGNTGALAVIISDAETAPADLIVTVFVSDSNLLPPSSIRLGGADGARTLTLTPPEGLSGTVVVTVVVSDGAVITKTASTTFTLVIEPLPSPIPPLVIPDQLLVAGPDPFVPGTLPPGTGLAVGVPDLLAAGGVRVALGDVTGDGVADTIAGTGPTVQNVVLVYDGKTGLEVFRFSPFEATFKGGVYVASADINRDGFAEIIVGAGESGGARVQVVSGKDRIVLADYFAIEDTNFRGGVRVAAGDMNGDRYPDVVGAAGESGGPRISGWDGYYLRPDRERRKLFADFFAFEPSVHNGSFVATGDLDGDGIAELVAGAGPGGAPRVTAFAGRALGRDGIVAPVANFFAFDPTDREGVRVAVRRFNSDGRDDLLAGSGSQQVVAVFSGPSTLASGAPDPIAEIDVLTGFLGGVFVA